MRRDPIAGPERRVVIRKYAPGDAQAVFAISQLAPEAAQWSAASYDHGVESGQTVLVAQAGHEICGFLASRLVGTEGEILNMAVTPSQRRKSIGSMLLAATIEEAKTKSVERMYLEVRESNRAAVSFYEKHGFAKSGQRIGYYSGPTENAVVMEKRLTG
ncbi:MAG: ribosomal protein S18-alanine N-acetyltransferase [Acidobacteriota bacterium]|nr:ribosomal protein S18-alanine N-acetyltransferase [Acidobacteriota bacterium]